uniref:Uncharacterized protein n=1 Tax=Molossus molossus TaxID=27622 RepID=A0A7J8BYN4_MOLMO|nr:hypothetical protein HJG59_010095 [Molossus molossus]
MPRRGLCLQHRWAGGRPAQHVPSLRRENGPEPRDTEQLLPDTWPLTISGQRDPQDLRRGENGLRAPAGRGHLGGCARRTGHQNAARPRQGRRQEVLAARRHGRAPPSHGCSGSGLNPWSPKGSRPIPEAKCLHHRFPEATSPAGGAHNKFWQKPEPCSSLGCGHLSRPGPAAPASETASSHRSGDGGPAGLLAGR